MNTPDHYEIRVAGHLPAHWQSRFDALTFQHDPCGETVMAGRIDQAALHGVLNQIRDLGLTIISVTLTANPTDCEENHD